VYEHEHITTCEAHCRCGLSSGGVSWPCSLVPCLPRLQARVLLSAAIKSKSGGVLYLYFLLFVTQSRAAVLARRGEERERGRRMAIKATGAQWCVRCGGCPSECTCAVQRKSHSYVQPGLFAFA
jgi:hypothetical protein